MSSETILWISTTDDLWVQEKKSTIEGQDVLGKYLFKKYPIIALLILRKKILKNHYKSLCSISKKKFNNPFSPRRQSFEYLRLRRSEIQKKKILANFTIFYCDLGFQISITLEKFFKNPSNFFKFYYSAPSYPWKKSFSNSPWKNVFKVFWLKVYKALEKSVKKSICGPSQSIC